MEYLFRGQSNYYHIWIILKFIYNVYNNVISAMTGTRTLRYFYSEFISNHAKYHLFTLCYFLRH